MRRLGVMWVGALDMFLLVVLSTPSMGLAQAQIKGLAGLDFVRRPLNVALARVKTMPPAAFVQPNVSSPERVKLP